MSRVPIVFAAVVIALTVTAQAAQAPFNDGQVITQFERAVDAYAFQHRQVQRRAGETVDQQAMAGAMRASRPSAEDGAIFTPMVAAAFHSRIATALRSGSCNRPSTDANFVVPRPNQDAGGTLPISACLAAVLPRLPAELEYRVAGVVLLLVDTHANLVVDVLHGAFP
jgi:hypothetical protein